MRRLQASFDWIIVATWVWFAACAPGADDGFGSDRRAQCSPVNDSNCRPKYCPTGSQHECAAQDLCDNFFSYECFDPKVDTAWSRLKEPKEPSLIDEYTAPFSAAGKTALWRVANPTASHVPLPQHHHDDPGDIITGDYIRLVVEQFVNPALALEDGLWNEVSSRVQSDSEYALGMAKQHALIYENLDRNSQWIRLFSRVMFGQEFGSLGYCEPWIERLHNPPDPSEYNAQLDYGILVDEVSRCLDMYRQVLAELFEVEEHAQLFSRSYTQGVLQSIEHTLDKLDSHNPWDPQYLDMLAAEYAAISDIHDSLRAFIEPTMSMLLRAQASYAWLYVKTPGVFRREAPTEIGKLAQRAAEEAYRSSVDPEQAGSWQEQYRRALSWYADTRITQLQTLTQLITQLGDNYRGNIDVSEHVWYFWGLMEASGLLALYPEYTAMHDQLRARFQTDLQRAADIEKTQIACAGFALSFVAPTAVLKAGKGAEAAVWMGRATKLALAGAVLAAMQTASTQRPDVEESAWMATLRYALPNLVSVDFWKDYGSVLAPQLAEAFAPSCFSLWEQHHTAEYLDAHASGIMHLSSLTSIVLHAGMTSTASLVDPGQRTSSDPTWAFLVLPTDHPEYALATKQVTGTEGYDMFAKNVGAARAAYGLQSTGRVRVTFDEHLDSLGNVLSIWEDQPIPFWERLGTALYGPEDWVPKIPTHALETLAANLAELLTSERPSRYDETWMELVRHMRSDTDWTVQSTETLVAGLSTALGVRARETLTSLLNAVKTTQQADAGLVTELLDKIPMLPSQGTDWQHAVQVSNELQQLQMRLVHLTNTLERRVALLSTVASRSR